jgi:hypothetical protein
MSIDVVRSTTHEIVEQLARGNYESLVGRSVKSDLRSEDIRKAIRDYGRNLVAPPRDAYKNLDAVQIQGAAVPTWSVRAPLWTEEEGRSDLTLELTIAVGPGALSIELDDIHVL